MRNTIRTERLRLRRWRETDRLPLQKINADPRVMEIMPEALPPKASEALIVRFEEHFEHYGFGLFAVDLIEGKTFAGFIGLSVPAFEAPFMPAVEVGWRLAFEYWGRGLATEGARAVVRYGVGSLGIDNIVSFTVPANLRSRRVMEKIGMTHDPRDDFDHPLLPEGHPLRRHVLYRLTH